jgi:hypothetical protein
VTWYVIRININKNIGIILVEKKNYYPLAKYLKNEPLQLTLKIEGKDEKGSKGGSR